MSLHSKKLSDKLNKIKVELATLKGVKSRIDAQILALNKKVSEKGSEARKKKEAHLLTLSFISARRETGIKSIENIGTHALKFIYGDDYVLHFLRNEEKKNSAAFKMEIGIESAYRNTTLITGLDDERGGGVAESTSFSLRFAAVEWLGYNGPIIFDEAFKSMSEDEKINRVAEFIKEYTSGRQLILSTHKSDIFSPFADNIVAVSKTNGISSAKKHYESIR